MTWGASACTVYLDTALLPLLALGRASMLGLHLVGAGADSHISQPF